MRRIVLIACLLLVASLSTLAETGSEPRHTTARVLFKLEGGQFVATVIPTSEDGAFPRSGWTDCTVPESLRGKVKEAMGGQDTAEGYYRVTYRKGAKKDTRVLRYRGELLKLESWTPSF